MASNCQDINPLTHSGTSRLDRALAALDPASAPLDGRDYKALILFAKRYAAYLQYYDLTDTKAGDWQPLMQMDIAVVLATLASDAMPLYEAYRTGIHDEILSIDANDAAHLAENEASAQKLLEALFDMLFSYVYHLDREMQLLAPGSEERLYLEATTRGKLTDAVLNLEAYYQQTLTAGLVDDSGLYIPPSLVTPTAISLASTLLSQPLSAIWQGTLPAVPALTGAGVLPCAKNLVTHNLFNAVVDTILKATGSVAAYAATRLEATLTTMPSHTPHYALFLTFIQLFRRAQDRLNGLTARHLGFYYNEVLTETNSPAVGDRAHLIIQLQKNTPALRLPAGTAFKAGKDADGKDIFYATQRDFTVTGASVKTLSALYVQAGHDASLGEYQTLLASPVANSGDGAGGALSTSDSSWFAFGNPKTTAMVAETGFAIASPQLYLREGTRTITLRISFAGSLSLTAAQLQGAFAVRLTAEKSWYPAAASDLTVQSSGNTLTLVVRLDSGAPAITGFDRKIHAGTFDTLLPVMQVILEMSKNTFNPILMLNSLPVTAMQVTVNVKGLKTLQVSTDTGAVDPSKPFMPFTTDPHGGSSMLIGCKEVFEKPLSDLEVMIQWDKLPPEGLDIYEKKNDIIYSGLNLADAVPADMSAPEDLNKYVGEHVTYQVGGLTRNIYFRKHTVLVSWLQDGIWVTEPAARGLFSGRTLFSTGDFKSTWLRPPLKYAQTVSLPGDDVWQNDFDFIGCPLGKFRCCCFEDQKDERYAVDAKNGFFKLSLSGDDFAHAAYLKQILDMTITTNGNTQTVSNRPDPPYTPLIKSLELGYTASCALAPAAGTTQPAFYQVYPFGVQRQLTPAFPLLPVYGLQGELYIGVEGLRPPETISMLFQLSEGSADPLSTPEPVQWHYLSGDNRWTPGDSHDIEDHTGGLLSSGLLIFAVPPDASTTGTAMMPGGLTWLRASVAGNAGAICRIISVQAQAVEAIFADILQTGNEYKAPVPAGTLSKLVLSNPLIKKISQPYASAGGSPRESDSDFRLRVSERLRHKQRAVNIWDYEHLVLQQFPGVYKVKCLNHTGLRPAQGSTSPYLQETWPGHVTVVTVAEAGGTAGGNPLLPYTPLGTLSDIRGYLQAIVNPFVQLDVVNPLFEQVQFDFKVRFLEGYDVHVYAELLNNAIEKFMSPWAFATGVDVEFQGKISKSVVLKFVEDQYYVDYVSCFRMNHWTDPDTGAADYDVEVATGTTARSILVSYYNPDTGQRHLITPILTETATCDCS